eukprot:PhM_4_TR14893/c0_g1_i1/m.93348
MSSVFLDPDQRRIGIRTTVALPQSKELMHRGRQVVAKEVDVTRIYQPPTTERRAHQAQQVESAGEPLFMQSIVGKEQRMRGRMCNVKPTTTTAPKLIPSPPRANQNPQSGHETWRSNQIAAIEQQDSLFDKLTKPQQEKFHRRPPGPNAGSNEFGSTVVGFPGMSKIPSSKPVGRVHGPMPGARPYDPLGLPVASPRVHQSNNNASLNPSRGMLPQIG